MHLSWNRCSARTRAGQLTRIGHADCLLGPGACGSHAGQRLRQLLDRVPQLRAECAPDWIQPSCSVICCQTTAAHGVESHHTGSLTSTGVLTGARLADFGNQYDVTANSAVNIAGHSLSQTAADVATCQAKGVQIVLSMGGGVGTYGFTSTADATR